MDINEPFGAHEKGESISNASYISIVQYGNNIDLNYCLSEYSTAKSKLEFDYQVPKKLDTVNDKTYISRNALSTQAITFPLVTTIKRIFLGYLY